MSASSPLRLWAGRLIERSGSAQRVDLRVADLLAAFAAGVHTGDGKALARFFGYRKDAEETIAAASAIARQSECDDIELTSCVTPGAAVIPVALAYSSENSGRIETAICRGYEAGIVCGRALGGASALPKVWPSLLAAPLMAAVTVAFMKGFDEDQLVHAMAISLAGVNGRAGRPAGAPSGRWVAFAEAVGRGIRAAEAAGRGFRGDPDLCTDEWWRTQAGHGKIDESVFVEPDWPDIDETEYKPFPIARQALCGLEAFQRILAAGADPARLESIDAVVPRLHAAMLSQPAVPDNRTSLLCNLGFQFASAAFAPELLYDPDRKGATAALVEFSRHVTVTPSDEFESEIAAGRWPARVVVRSANRMFTGEAESTSLGANQQESSRAADAARLSPRIRGDDRLVEKWRRILHGEDRRDFFENVINRQPGSHAMLWEWVKQRLAGAAA
jgi:2-methylcitrate dehydratase PrpD